MPHISRIAEKGFETINNLVVRSGLFALLIERLGAAEPTILWFGLKHLLHRFWRLDQPFSGSEDRVVLCASKPSGKHAGFWLFLRCSQSFSVCSQLGHSGSSCCSFCALSRFSVIPTAQPP